MATQGYSLSSSRPKLKQRSFVSFEFSVVGRITSSSPRHEREDLYEELIFCSLLINTYARIL